MKDALIAYLVAAGLNLALLWRETELPYGSTAMHERPALVRVHDGPRVSVTPRDGQTGYSIGLLIDQWTYVTLGDPASSLFPNTALVQSLEPPISILN